MGKVQVELWYSSNNIEAFNFTKDFGNYAEQLKDYMEFTPRFISWSCTSCDSTFKKEECLNDGLYCAPSNPRGRYGSNKGLNVLFENIRESCLYDMLSAKDAQEKWWAYMK